ncbi:hypothetical protein [Streptomyces sp. NPDC001851]|uniref:hypothetical protein n=1 Tax=Streptomyces sp. NPDC001851 TaxID=3154529 RepID=UPI00332631DC
MGKDLLVNKAQVLLLSSDRASRAADVDDQGDDVTVVLVSRCRREPSRNGTPPPAWRRWPSSSSVDRLWDCYGHSVEVVVCDLGSERREAVPDLRVLVVDPGPRSASWAYVTAGCWAAMEKDGHGLEFVMTARVRDRRFIDLMAMIACYHCGGHQLDLEHSMPIGEPWVPGSTCDHLLISLPYLHGPGLEHCPLPGGTPAFCGPCP